MSSIADLDMLVSVASLEKGVLKVPTAKPEDMQLLYKLLSSAIMGLWLPHYRVIGIRIDALGNNDTFISKPRGCDKSYADVYKVAKDLVFVNGIVEKEVFEWEVLEEKLEGIGYLQTGGCVTSSNGSLLFAGRASEEVKVLVEDVDIINSSASTTIKLITYRGTGVLSFSDAAYKLRTILTDNNVEGTKGFSAASMFVPFRAVYDLNDFLFVRPYSEEEGVDKLFFHYKAKVNDNALLELIQKFLHEQKRKAGTLNGCNN